MKELTISLIEELGKEYNKLTLIQKNNQKVGDSYYRIGKIYDVTETTIELNSEYFNHDDYVTFTFLHTLDISELLKFNKGVRVKIIFDLIGVYSYYHSATDRDSYSVSGILKSIESY